jgi:hypothetical protein
MAVGIVVFVASYIYKSIENAIAEYKEAINIE